ncbi:ASCH domain-containing protein [Mesorhizobium sp. M0293]|uniref:ASCH domain-containing protein n=1 Tax=unclassified Mesorhizobium TaxID=325217 RepID=UPI0033389816
MQELGVVPRLFPLVVAGQKTSTIRWRETTIVPGYMRYVCDGDATSTAIVWVTRCTEMPLSEAAAFVGRESEWPMDVMLSGMREHYPEIEWTDIVQIVEHLTPADSMRLSSYPAATP